jgi:lipopolysaccharide export system permease protein
MLVGTSVIYYVENYSPTFCFVRLFVNRLDRYLFMQSLKPLLLMTVCITAVVWLTQVLQRSEIMVDDGGSFAAFARVTFLIIPNLLTIITPFTLLAATLFMLNRLKSDSELAALQAAGTSTLRLARPVLFLAILGTAFTYYMNMQASPSSYREVKEIVRDVRNDIAQSLIRSGVFTTVDDGLMVYAEEVRPGGQYLGMLIYDQRNPEDPVTYMAESGLYNVTPAGPRLHLARGTVQRSSPENSDVDIVQFIETAVDLTPYQHDGSIAYREGSERYVSELLFPDMTNPYDVQQAGILVAEGHSRLSTPFYNILYVLIALVALLRGTFTRFGYSRRIMMAVGAAIALRVFGFVAESAAATSAVFNVLQYLIPIGGSAICLILLIGNPRLGLRKKKRVRTSEIYLDRGATV